MSTRKRSSVLLVVLMFVSVVGAGLAHVTLRLGVVRRCYEIGQLTRERQALEEQQRRLQLEEALLRNPARIALIAREQLHMKQPDPEQIKVVQPGVSQLARR